MSAERAVDLYATGLSLKAVSRRLGISASTVGHILERRGVARRPYTLHRVPQRDRIVALYRSGVSIAGVTRQTGVGSHTLNRVLREEGIFRPKGRRLPWDDIVARYQQGQSTIAIAADLDISTSGVRDILVACGVPRRPIGRRLGSAPRPTFVDSHP